MIACPDKRTSPEEGDSASDESDDKYAPSKERTDTEEPDNDEDDQILDDSSDDALNQNKK